MQASRHTAVEKIDDLRKKLAGIGVIKSQLGLRITLSDYQEVSLKLTVDVWYRKEGKNRKDSLSCLLSKQDREYFKECGTKRSNAIVC